MLKEKLRCASIKKFDNFLCTVKYCSKHTSCIIRDKWKKFRLIMCQNCGSVVLKNYGATTLLIISESNQKKILKTHNMLQKWGFYNLPFWYRHPPLMLRIVIFIITILNIIIIITVILQCNSHSAVYAPLHQQCMHRTRPKSELRGNRKP